MKKKITFFIAMALVAFAMFVNMVAAQNVVITQWNFDDETLNPIVGNGSATNIGGNTFTWAAGNGPAPSRGWNTSTYPAQSTNSGTAGVEFMVSTVGFENIVVEWYQRSSGTASRWAQYEYTPDGGTTWNVLGNNDGGLSPHDTYYPFSLNLSTIPAASNNPGFGIRIVSIFSPFAFDQNATLTYGANEAYQRANAQSGPPGTGTGTGDYGTGGTWRFDDVIFSGESISGSDATQLSIWSVNGGNTPQVNIPFYLTVFALDINGVPANVSVETTITLSVDAGTGSLGGILSAIIPVGAYAVTFNDLTYNVAESGVSVVAQTSLGMVLQPATASFSVLAGASHLAFDGFPASGNVNQSIVSFQVLALRNDNSVDEHYNGLITIAKATGPGNISGTLAVNAINGAATFNDVAFDLEGEYSLAASAENLTGATSEVINIAGQPEGIIAYWNFDDETLNPSIGSGTAVNVGGTSTSFAAGLTGNPDRGWNTSFYPEQATGSSTAGVEFMISTVGYQNIQISLYQRNSGTASRFVSLQYTLDGSNWIGYEVFANMPYDVFVEHNFDFSAIQEANNNPDFGIRILAVFSPEAFTDPLEPFTQWGANEAYRATRDDRNYSPSGTWRFDEVIFTGETGTILPGDANCDELVNVLDIITIVNHVLGQNPVPFCFENADVNGDELINILDIVGVVNILLGGGK